MVVLECGTYKHTEASVSIKNKIYYYKYLYVTWYVIRPHMVTSYAHGGEMRYLNTSTFLTSNFLIFNIHIIRKDNAAVPHYVQHCKDSIGSHNYTLNCWKCMCNGIIEKSVTKKWNIKLSSKGLTIGHKINHTHSFFLSIVFLLLYLETRKTLFNSYQTISFYFINIIWAIC